METSSFSFSVCLRSVTVLLALAILPGCPSLLDSGSGSSSSSAAPSIELRYGLTTVASGGTVNAGSVLIGGRKDLVFAIRNKGSKFLVLSGNPAVAFEGSDASQFALRTAGVPSILHVGEYAAFKVRFTPTSPGTKSASLRIPCSDAQNLRFAVTLACVADPIAVTGVTLSDAALFLTVGSTGFLGYAVTPANATNAEVTWSSSNPSAATVSEEGLVTGLAVGSSTVTATTTDGNFTASCAVVVYVPAVTGVSISPAELALTAGESGKLSQVIAPSGATNKYVSWSSSDTTKATVSASGLVTAIAGGSATITATTSDGGYTATCPVNVYNPASWTNVAASSPSPYTARRYHQSLAYNGKLYVIGGNRDDDAILNDVWSSSDGINWSNILSYNTSPGPTQFTKRRHHSCIVFKDKMWVIAGEDWSGTGLPTNDVWSSTDGIAWTQVLADTATPGPNQFSQRSFVSLTTDGDKMYILGGYLKNPGPNNNFSNDVWSSTDGAIWTQVKADLAAGGFTARVSAGAYILNGVVYIFGGDDTSGTVGDLWTSTDGGATWTKLADPGVGLRADFAGLPTGVSSGSWAVINPAMSQ